MIFLSLSLYLYLSLSLSISLYLSISLPISPYLSLSLPISLSISLYLSLSLSVYIYIYIYVYIYIHIHIFLYLCIHTRSTPRSWRPWRRTWGHGFPPTSIIVVLRLNICIIKTIALSLSLLWLSPHNSYIGVMAFPPRVLFKRYMAL